ncbi:MAG: hypothetical protein GX848_03800 [Clostridiales bacterium]|nr:hypothetical protein [Clostridiales bacterium]
MVYVTGDTHGCPERLSKSELKMLKEGDTLIICGDFGFVWDDGKKEQKVLLSLSKRKYNICFVDGTHENFNLLNKYPVKTWNGGLVHEIKPNIMHLMRGELFNIDELSIFTMGGGESPDLDVRFETASWDKGEIPTQSDLLRGAQKLEEMECKVDIIITHEPPSKIKGFLKLAETDQIRVTALNAYFDELSATCTFKHWFFGSLHMDKFISNTHIGLFKNIINAHTGEKC